MNVGIVTPAFEYHHNLTGKLLRIISVVAPSIDGRIYTIAGDFKVEDNPRVSSIRVLTYPNKRLILKIIRYGISQMAISWKILRTYRKVDVFVFQWGASLILPMITVKLLRKKVILVVTGSSHEDVRLIYRGIPGAFFNILAWLIARINYTVCDRIGMIFDNHLAAYLELQRYGSKIVPFPLASLIIDKDFFVMKKCVSERENIVGYAARLDSDKAALEFSRAIPLILAERSDFRFIVAGDGTQIAAMKDELKQCGCLDRVCFTGWLSHEELIECLNDMKVYVLPTYTEGVPGSIAEAMSCGAISVATRVAGIPDLIEHGVNGFLLEDNSPRNIADTVLRVIDRPDLENIQSLAREYVEQNFSYEKAVERCRLAFSSFAESGK